MARRRSRGSFDPATDMIPSSLEEKLRSGGHKDNGFDTIRLIAAALVLVSHSFPIGIGSNEAEPLNMITRGQTTLGGLSVAVFFFISGLLISNSFDASSSLRAFALKRVLRIMPALVAVCLVLAFIVGPACTELPLVPYFEHAWRFMENAVFLPTDYALPGVFSSHPIVAANGSLWSLKFEVACYIAAALLLAARRRRLVIPLVLWLSSFVVARSFSGGHGQSGADFYLGTLAGLYRFFGAGVVFYLLRERLLLNARVAWVALLVTLLSAATPFFMEAAATCGAYALLVFAYRCPTWFRRLTARGDISYGTYVYAFPTQQIAYSVVGPHPWLITAVALPITLALATISWILVERPALKMKRLPLSSAAQSKRQPAREIPEDGKQGVPSW